MLMLVLPTAFLAALQLFANSLSGTIPSTIGLLTNLRECHLLVFFQVFLFLCRLSILSSSFWPSAVELFLNENKMIGRIPTEIGLLGGLEEVKLSRNFHNGTIPSEVGLMTSLIRILFNENSLMGTIPPLRDLSNLELLSLRTNKLTGTIPPAINNLTNLDFLALSLKTILRVLLLVLPTLQGVESLVTPTLTSVESFSCFASFAVVGYSRTVQTKGSITKVFWTKEDEKTTETLSTYSIPTGFIWSYYLLVKMNR